MEHVHRVALDKGVGHAIRARAILQPRGSPIPGVGRDSGIESASPASSLANASARSPRISSGNASISLRHGFRMTITLHCLTYETTRPALRPATVPLDQPQSPRTVGSAGACARGFDDSK